MKMIQAIIRPEVLERVKKELGAAGYQGLTIYDVRGRGRQMGISWRVRGNEYRIDILPKVKIELVVRDEQVEQVIEIIKNAASTGQIGDGKIFVLPVIDAVRIRTGERGEEAIE